jgi:hypothetical protein
MVCRALHKLLTLSKSLRSCKNACEFLIALKVLGKFSSFLVVFLKPFLIFLES